MCVCARMSTRVCLCVDGHKLAIQYGTMGNWVGLYIKAILSICSLKEFLRTAFPFFLAASRYVYLFLLIASAHHQLHHPVNYFASLSSRSGSSMAQKTGKFLLAHHPSWLPPKLQAPLSQFLLQIYPRYPEFEYSPEVKCTLSSTVQIDGKDPTISCVYTFVSPLRACIYIYIKA